MTKEELEKEAEKYLKQKLEERKAKFVFELPKVYIKDVKETYLAGAEPREKRIAELEGKLRRAETLNYQDAKLINEYGDRIDELETQVKYWKSEYDKLFNEVWR